MTNYYLWKKRTLQKIVVLLMILSIVIISTPSSQLLAITETQGVTVTAVRQEKSKWCGQLVRK